jgi:hypothetical protein
MDREGRYHQCVCGQTHYLYRDEKGTCDGCGRVWLLHEIEGRWYADLLRRREEPVCMSQAIRTGIARKRQQQATP